MPNHVTIYKSDEGVRCHDRTGECRWTDSRAIWDAERLDSTCQSLSALEKGGRPRDGQSSRRERRGPRIKPNLDRDRGGQSPPPAAMFCAAKVRAWVVVLLGGGLFCCRSGAGGCCEGLWRSRGSARRCTHSLCSTPRVKRCHLRKTITM